MNVILQVIVDGQIEKHHKDLKLISRGFQPAEHKKKNAFLNPNDPSAEFPQFVPKKIIDFRSSHNPYSGYEMPGNARKNVYRTQVVEEADEAPVQKTKEDELIEADLLNKLVEMKIGPDRHRAIEKKVDQHRGRQTKGKAQKRQLKFWVAFGQPTIKYVHLAGHPNKN